MKWISEDKSNCEIRCRTGFLCGKMGRPHRGGVMGVVWVCPEHRRQGLRNGSILDDYIHGTLGGTQYMDYDEYVEMWKRRTELDEYRIKKGELNKAIEETDRRIREADARLQEQYAKLKQLQQGDPLYDEARKFDSENFLNQKEDKEDYS